MAPYYMIAISALARNYVLRAKKADQGVGVNASAPLFSLLLSLRQVSLQLKEASAWSSELTRQTPDCTLS